MAKQIINIGQTANDKSGDPLRTAFSKVNDNFTELYSRSAETSISSTAPESPQEGQLWYDIVDGRLYIFYNDAWVDASPKDIYTLPEASDTVLGGIKVGANLLIDSDGVLSVSMPPGTVISDTAPESPEVGQLWYDSTDGRLYIFYSNSWVDTNPESVYVLPKASDTVLGGIKVGNNLSIDGDGVLSATIAAQVNSDWNASSGVARILNKPNITSNVGGDVVSNANFIPNGDRNLGSDTAGWANAYFQADAIKILPASPNTKTIEISNTDDVLSIMNGGIGVYDSTGSFYNFEVTNDGYTQIHAPNAGVGTAVVTINSNSSNTVIPLSQTSAAGVLHVSGNNSGPTVITSDNYDSSNPTLFGNRITWRRLRGTPDSPAVVAANDLIGSIEASSWTGSTFLNTNTGRAAAIRIRALETSGPGNQGAQIELYATPTGTATNNQAMVIGGTNVNVPLTTNSTSTTTGAFTTAGGAGIAQDLYVGGTVNTSTIVSNSGLDLYTGSNESFNVHAGTSGSPSVFNISADGLITAHTPTPPIGSAILKISANSSSTIQPVAVTTRGALLHLTGDSVGATNTIIDNFDNTNPANSAGIFTFRRYRGTVDTPTAVQSGDLLAALGTTAFDGTSTATSPTQVTSIRFVASEDQTPLAKGSRIDLYAIPVGSPDRALSLTVSGTNVNVPLTTSATSSSTGALTVAGGAGIGGKLYTGDEIWSTKSIYVTTQGQGFYGDYIGNNGSGEDFVIRSNPTSDGTVHLYGNTVSIHTTSNENPVFQVQSDGQVVILTPTFDPTEGAVSIIGSPDGSFVAPTASGTMIHVTGQPGTIARQYIDSVSQPAHKVGRRYNGTSADPVAVNNGEVVARFVANAYNGGASNNGFASIGLAYMEMVATEDQTATANGGQINFWTTANGTTNNVNSISIVPTGIKFSDSTVQSTAGIPLTQKGQQNGVATLGSDGKVPNSQLPAGSTVYLGTWDASTNSPHLANGSGVAGNEYAVSVSGTVDFGAGGIAFNAGDFVIYNGTVWQRIPTAVGVSSFNGRNGSVTLTSSDVTTALTYTPYNGSTNPNGYVNSAGAAAAAPVQTVFGRTGAVTLQSSDVTTALNNNSITNAKLANSSITINSTSVPLGGSFTGVVTTSDTGTVTNTMLAGSIANSKLTNSTISINGSPIALGSGITGIVTTSDTGTVTNTMLAGSITNAKLVNSSVTINGTAISLGSSATVTAAASTLTGTTLSSGVTSSSLTSLGTLGALTVSGNTTTGTLVANANVNASSATGAISYGTLGYSDTNIMASFSSSVNSYNQVVIQNTNNGANASSNLIVSNNNGTSSSYYGEFGMNSGTYTGTGAFSSPNAVYLSSQSSDLVIATQSNNAIHFVTNGGTNTSDVLTISGAGVATFANTIVGSINGNAGTATKLATARNINGVAFDGTQDITITASSSAGSLTGTTLASNVVNSSLTSVGTLTNLTVTNTITGSVSGNAGTVTNGVYTTDTGTVTNTMLAGSIANNKLLNSSVTIGSTAISLGATSTTLAGLTSVTATTFAGALSGNATTATTLQTARQINGVNFDGSANITVAASAGTLTGTTLNSTVVSSSLTSVGTLANLTVTNTITGSVSGNAGTATTLQTARNINGVSFNGSADITVTAAAGTLTGNTLNSTVVNSSLTSVGTLTNLTVTNTITGSVSGNAGTATNLAGTSSTLIGSLSISPTAIGKTNVSTQTYTLTGLTTNHKVLITCGTAQVYGVSIIGAWASATNTLSIQWSNSTGGNITPPATSIHYYAWV